MCGRDMLAHFFKHWYLGVPSGHGLKKEITFWVSQKQKHNKKKLQSIACNLKKEKKVSQYSDIRFLFVGAIQQ